MTDLLSHVLAVYAVLTVVSWWRDGLEERHVAVAVVGVVLPDFSKVFLLVSESTISSLLGLPFSWHPLHRLGGVVVLAAAFSLLFERSRRLQVAGYALLGGLAHFPLDALLIRADGHSPPYFYPLSWWQPPAGDLFLSSDLWPVIPIGLLAAAVWLVDRRHGDPRGVGSP